MPRQFLENTDFAVERPAASDDEPNGRIGKFTLQTTDLVSRRIIFPLRPEQNFKLRIVLTDLGNEGRIGVGIETAKRLENGHRLWLLRRNGWLS